MQPLVVNLITHHVLIAGYQGQLDMESLPNEEDVAFAKMGGMMNRLGSKKSTKVIAILDATQDPKVIAEQLSAALSCRQRISKLLGPGGVKLVEDALALGGKSLADAQLKKKSMRSSSPLSANDLKLAY